MDGSGTGILDTQQGTRKQVTNGSPTSRGFYRRYGKRLLDVSLSLLGLLFLSPLMIVVAIAVKFSSRGGAFFSQKRTGLRENEFNIWKFRTMVAGAPSMGPSITAAGDPRITRMGAFLRRSKLDELPQLWNVLKGEMSLVGPRPELPVYVRDYSPEQRRVFSVRPGVTDPASLEYRNEEEILATAIDRERFYKETILPHKLSLNQAYIDRLSLRFDLLLILKTAKILIFRDRPTAEGGKTQPPAALL
jgi:lipopolysaccharide/colanic/teichoic acid biosynthesis glycosyltransferase